MSEARRENNPLRVLALELLRALTSRRYSNTDLIDSYQPLNTRVDSIYIALLSAKPSPTPPMRRGARLQISTKTIAFQNPGGNRLREKDHLTNGKRNG